MKKSKSRAQELVAEIRAKEAELSVLKRDLAKLQAGCQHERQHIDDGAGYSDFWECPFCGTVGDDMGWDDH